MSYGSDSTVICLLYINAKTSFEGWDEANVAADVTFILDEYAAASNLIVGLCM